MVLTQENSVTAPAHSIPATQCSYVPRFPAGSRLLKAAVLEILEHTPHILYETAEPIAPNPGTSVVEHSGYDICVCLLATTCYRNDVAEDIAKALSEHYQLPESISSPLHLCLHEAVTNAVIHGNFSVPSAFKNKETLTTYYQWVESMLTVPALAFSHVHIYSTQKDKLLIIDVVDEGKGYSHEHYLGPDNRLELHQGLSLIRQCCTSVNVLNTGNHIQMEFLIA